LATYDADSYTLATVAAAVGLHGNHCRKGIEQGTAAGAVLSCHNQLRATVADTKLNAFFVTRA
jgi:hypothetical protein